MAKVENLALDRLISVLSYDAEGGDFTWLVATGRRAACGDIAGWNSPHGYRMVRLDGRQYYAHRLAWFYVHGRWPTCEIDHINGVKTDNRLCNLREASSGENRMNRPRPSRGKSRYVGVSFDTKHKKWTTHFKRKWLGYFDTEEAAHDAYVVEVRKFSAQFPIPQHPDFGLTQQGAL